MTRLSRGQVAASFLLLAALSACSSGEDAAPVATTESTEPVQSAGIATSSPLAELDWRENFPTDPFCDTVGDLLSAEAGVQVDVITTRTQPRLLQCVLRSDAQPSVDVVLDVQRLPANGRLESGEAVELADDQAYADHYLQLGFEDDPSEAERAGASLALFRFDDQDAEAMFVGGENLISLSLTGLPATRADLATTVGSAIAPDASRGVLSVHEVVALAAPGAAPTEQGNQVLAADDGGTYEIGPVVLPGEDVSLVEAVEVLEGTWAVDVHLTPRGADTWVGISESACALNPQMPLMALVVAERIISAPQVSNCDSIEKLDRVRLSGSWNQAEAEALVDGISQSG